ncbi:exopolysaccharide production protein YjbE [Kosakonia sp. BYX6]|uniref:Exopolysaccharide production protein YjbE n=1 Tax=Kosakonia calanthes TaxID=3139408 RepID=A0ABZ3B250_9ENTR
MTRVKCIILAFPFIICGFCYAAPVEEGTAAGDNASEFAVGSSVLTGTAVITAATGLLLLSMGGTSDGSNSSTTTTTTTTATAPSN